ncbi:Ribulose-phosphate 3-epimerase [Planctomycetes bacterium Pan216]|uniref:Ribulose-phosphate 3-epimerase n=1 Tax=Kolteria novifilia TaxID=2527975 RepID=A0A518BCQ0_9BACT|nr:Ribulose-phosphate 3-epimerase [Planctomycetes bacterium Pan216]
MHPNRSQLLERLRNTSPRICPSLLDCDFSFLKSEIDDAERCGAEIVHWDVMDGFFVPNFSYGPMVIRSLRPQSQLVFEAHLMMKEPGKYLDGFLEAGCDVITIHLEAVPDPTELLRAIRDGGALAGLAVNPPTPIEQLEPWLDQIDLALVMSVMPGFGGQSFDQGALERMRWVRERSRPELIIEVDGGVNRTTISDAVRAGARHMVVGSAFYRAQDRAAEFQQLTQLVNEGVSSPGAME